MAPNVIDDFHAGIRNQRGPKPLRLQTPDKEQEYLVDALAAELGIVQPCQRIEQLVDRVWEVFPIVRKASVRRLVCVVPTEAAVQPVLEDVALQMIPADK